MAKFAVVETNALSVLFSNSNISFTKPNCKKKNPPKLAQKSTTFSKAAIDVTQVITLSGFCNSIFQFELFSWESNSLYPMTTCDQLFISNLSYRYLDNFSPPPQLG